MADNNTDKVASLIELAGDITIAWLQNPNVNPAAQDVPAFLKDLHTAIAELNGDVAVEAPPVTHEPAVPVRSSVKAGYLVSLIDGRKYKALKRHLTVHGLTPDTYRERYGLRADYPMVAPDYAAQRREIAQKLGLGRKRPVEAAAAEPVVEVPAAPVKAKAAPARKAKAETVSEAVPAPVPVAKAKKAKPAPEPAASEAKGEVSAKARRMARQATAEVAAEPATDAPKPKRAAKAKAEPAAKAEAPAKRTRAKKPAPDAVAGETTQG